MEHHLQLQTAQNYSMAYPRSLERERWGNGESWRTLKKGKCSRTRKLSLI